MTQIKDITTQSGLATLTAQLAAARGVTGKTDIAVTVAALGLDAGAIGRPGDDCAALPDGHGGWTLFAGEGFIPGFVNADPWFAGWCGVMVNISDVLAMGGRPTAVINAIWAPDAAAATPMLEGMAAASQAYGVPIVGGHSNFGARELNLSVSVLGHATHLMTSFDATPGDLLICAVDHRGAYRAPFDNWQAALDAPPARLRRDAALMADLAATGHVTACKDISQAGIPGTALMLAECSGVEIDIDLGAVPVPSGVRSERWLSSFPSFGFLMTVARENVADVTRAFTDRDISAAVIGRVCAGSKVTLTTSGHSATFWDYAQTLHDPFTSGAHLCLKSTFASNGPMERLSSATHHLPSFQTTCPLGENTRWSISWPAPSARCTMLATELSKPTGARAASRLRRPRRLNGAMPPHLFPTPPL